MANAAPDSLELNGSTLLENAPIGTQVGELISTDPDSNSSLTFSLVDGNDSQHNQLFEIHQNQILRSLHSLDYETNATAYSIRIRVTDPYAASLERTFSISLLNEVEDLDGDQIEDFYDSDDDGDGFPDSVEIAYGSDPRDPNSLANAAPDSLELNGSTFLENALIGTQVGELIATDPDFNSSLTFSLVDGNDSQHNQLFEIHQNQILRSLHSLDYETNATTYSVRIRVTDPYAASLERTFSISLHNVIEDFDQDGIEDHFDPDDDNDGFSDQQELEFGSDSLNPEITPINPLHRSLFPPAPSLKIFRLAVTLEIFPPPIEMPIHPSASLWSTGTDPRITFFLKSMLTDLWLPVPLLISNPTPRFIRSGYRFGTNGTPAWRKAFN